jgi:DNA-binding MarR family transcriptional regulator
MHPSKEYTEPETLELLEFVELFFFAYRDFVSDPDRILEEFGFGRAHHRVIHFVGRNPNIRVANLLNILKITKQSLGRVLKQLVDEGYIEQKAGTKDRRERRLLLTPAGRELARKLAKPQLDRIAKTLAAAEPEAKAYYHRIFYAMIDQENRSYVEDLVHKG